MSEITQTISGVLSEDGKTLRLDQKSTLPAGPVAVTLSTRETGTRTAGSLPLVETLEKIVRDRKARGERQMTEKEMAEAIKREREEDHEYDARFPAY